MLMERTGKVASALLIVGLAGYMIIGEQMKQNALAGPPTASARSTTESPRVEDLVTRIDVQMNAEQPKNLASLSPVEFRELLGAIDLSRTNPVRFATSKSGPPPGVSHTIRLHLSKGLSSDVHKESINVSSLETAAWDELNTKLARFYVTQIAANIRLIKNDGTRTELLGIKQEQLNTLLADAKEKNTAYRAFATSKSLPADAIHYPYYDLELVTHSKETIRIGMPSTFGTFGAFHNKEIAGDWLLSALHQPKVYMDYANAGELVHEQP